jgi:hypothetical protein
MSFWETVESSSAASYLPANLRGTGFGLRATVNGLGDVISSVLVGALWAFQPTATMGSVIVSSLLGAVVIDKTEPAAPSAPVPPQIAQTRAIPDGLVFREPFQLCGRGLNGPASH